MGARRGRGGCVVKPPCSGAVCQGGTHWGGLLLPPPLGFPGLRWREGAEPEAGWTLSLDPAGLCLQAQQPWDCCIKEETTSDHVQFVYAFSPTPRALSTASLAA